MVSVLKRIGSTVLLGVLLLTLLPIGTVQTACADDVVLKVGYSGQGTVQFNEDGSFTGYVVDYLEEISRYTGWKYEFLYDTWENNVEKIRSGELDLMGMTRYTPQRAEYFRFSDLTMAQDYTALYAPQDSDIYYQDYQTMQGCRVAVVSQAIYETVFVQWADELALDYELAYYPTDAEARYALFSGEVDLYAAGGYSDHTDLKVVDRFGLTGAYLVTGLMNQDLMDQLDAAVRQARMKNPTMENDLAEKYYGDKKELYLTREEHEYLQNSGVIPVLGFGGRQPLGYADEDGSLAGILQDYLDMLGNISGMEFQLVESDPLQFDQLLEQLETQGGVMMFVDRERNDSSTIYRSEPVFQTDLTYIRRKDNTASAADGYVFAINSEMTYLEPMIREVNENHSVRYFSSARACMEAVLSGEADMTIQNEYVAEYELEKPKFADQLTRIPGISYIQDMCLYASEEHEYLVSILNKTLECVSEEQRAGTLANAMVAHGYTYEIEDVLYEYGDVIRISLVLLAVIVVLAAVLYSKIASFNAQKKEKEELQERIRRDELTDLYNRNGFLIKAGEMIEQGGDDLYIVRLNICHFKVVNELNGTEKGDRLLREIGLTLRRMAKEHGFVAARFTADRFYLCISRNTFDSLDFTRRSYVSWLGMNVNTIYGIYPVGERKEISVNAMCDRADMAIAANHSVTSYIYYYSDESRQRLLREREIENEMERAVAEKQFCIYIQPKYDIQQGVITGGEALVRWIHPEKGMVPPGEFISLFERNGFILRLDYYVWEECCRFLAETRRKGLPQHPISINVSRIHFYSAELKNKLMEILERYGLNPGDLELEITESICSEEPELIFNTCEELRQAGFKIAMDDFGSGYSSLNMLKEMPLDIIKMDLRFLSGETDETQREKGRNILRTLIQLAHTLQLKVVVEGLETAEQKEFIQSIGGCVAQGYFYSKPVDCQHYEEMIRSPYD